MSFTLTILDDSNHTATVSKQTLGRAGEAGEIITVVTPASLYNLGYDAYLHFLLPDGTPVYKGSYPCTSASFTVTIGATDNILALEGTIIMQFVLMDGTAYVWKSEEKRLDVVSSVNATAPATDNDYLYVQIPTTFVALNLASYNPTTHKLTDSGYAVGSSLTGVARPDSFTNGNIATYNPSTYKLVDTGYTAFYHFNVKDYGAIGDGTTDDTVAIQGAILAAEAVSGGIVFIPVGNYKITAALHCTVSGVTITGVNRDSSTIEIPATFTLADPAVFDIDCAEPGIIIQHLGINFTQPDTTVRASLTAYPPAIRITAPRTQLINIKIQQAIVGIDLIDNAGGCTLDNINMSAYTSGVKIDGCLDTVRINNLHFWVFGLTEDQKTIFLDSSNVGVLCGRCDDLKVTNCLFYCNKSLSFFIGATGAAFGEIIGCDFDNNFGIEGKANFVVTGCQFTASRTTDQFVLITGGNWTFSSCSFYAAASFTNPAVQVNNATEVSVLMLSACKFASGPHDVTMLNSSGYGRLVVNGCYFDRDINLNWTKPTVVITAGLLLMANCYANDKGTGTGAVVINAAGDVEHRIIGNYFPGWTITTTGVEPIVEHN